MILNAYLSFNYNIFLFLLNDEMIVNNTDFRFGQIDKKKKRPRLHQIHIIINFFSTQNFFFFFKMTTDRLLSLKQ